MMRLPIRIACNDLQLILLCQSVSSRTGDQVRYLFRLVGKLPSPCRSGVVWYTTLTLPKSRTYRRVEPDHGRTPMDHRWSPRTHNISMQIAVIKTVTNLFDSRTICWPLQWQLLSYIYVWGNKNIITARAILLYIRATRSWGHFHKCYIRFDKVYQSAWGSANFVDLTLFLCFLF